MELENFPTVGPQIPWFILGDRLLHRPEPKMRVHVYYWLKCPRCGAHFPISVGHLMLSELFTRPCPHCFKVSVLPEYLHKFVRKPEA